MPNLSWFRERAKSIKRSTIRMLTMSNDKMSKEEIVHEVIERNQTNQLFPESDSDDDTKLELNKPSESIPDTKNEISDENLERFVKRLGLIQFPKYGEYSRNDLKKFYDFAGENFEWPVNMRIPERRMIINYIIRRDEKIGRELATNAIAYRRLYESNKIESSKGSYVLIVNGEIKRYGEKISSEEYRELEEKYPGKYYVPTVEKPIVLRRFSALDDRMKNVWRVNIWIQDEEEETIDYGFRMVIDSGSTVTVIPYSMREQLHDPLVHWMTEPKYACGYADGEPIFQVSKPWNLCIGDGSNWSDWFQTSELYSWDDDYNDGLVGYDVLDNIPHYKRIGQPYVFLRNSEYALLSL
ncbi:hypothetical protein C1645_838784 [Glomus cerebriforme]|uniref:Peptidase A2 domain-containing protein n=1 Tax=Glomus cerebriforme TaxID=658196 RepID=A0A397S8S1_9GLOM|nr:hypothetical protein C1645_838784 [Glomus cerebriforme]